MADDFGDLERSALRKFAGFIWDEAIEPASLAVFGHVHDARFAVDGDRFVNKPAHVFDRFRIGFGFHWDFKNPTVCLLELTNNIVVVGVDISGPHHGFFRGQPSAPWRNATSTVATGPRKTDPTLFKCFGFGVEQNACASALGIFVVDRVLDRFDARSVIADFVVSTQRQVIPVGFRDGHSIVFAWCWDAVVHDVSRPTVSLVTKPFWQSQQWQASRLVVYWTKTTYACGGFAMCKALRQTQKRSANSKRCGGRKVVAKKLATRFRFRHRWSAPSSAVCPGR